MSVMFSLQKSCGQVNFGRLPPCFVKADGIISCSSSTSLVSCGLRKWLDGVFVLSMNAEISCTRSYRVLQDPNAPVSYHCATSVGPKATVRFDISNMIENQGEIEAKF